MKRALFDDKWITRLPTDNLRPLKTKPRKRTLVTPSEIEKICSLAFQPVFSEGKVVESGNGKPLANAQEFSDFIKLMSMSGGRASETLRLKRSDVDLLNRQLTFGSDGLAKNGKLRRVDFNPRLEAHLKDMFSRLAPDSEWLLLFVRGENANPPPPSGYGDVPLLIVCGRLDGRI